MIETQCDASQQPNLDGYCKPVANVRPKTPGAPYHSGGILIYVKTHIRKGITYMPVTNSEYCWLKLKGSYFKIPHDIYVVIEYVSNGSFASKNDDIFSLIENDAAKYSSDGSQIIACGDFNAHTNCDPDFQAADTSERLDDILNLPLNIPSNIPIRRNNLDSRKSDDRGRNLLQLCKTTGLRILNGRFFGDTLGNFTCYSHSGDPSTIDYMLATTPVYNRVQYFHVNDLSVHSIHCSLSMSLSMGTVPNYDISSSIHTNYAKKYYWAPGDELKFQKALSTSQVQNDILHLMESKPIQTENIGHYVDKLSSNFTEIIDKAANAANIKLKTFNRSSNKKNFSKKRKTKPWFDEKCKLLKNVYNRLAKALKRDPFNRKHRYELTKARKLYKGLVKENKNVFQKNMYSKLDDFQKHNPKEYWKLLNDLRGLDDKYNKNPVPMKDWVNHFTKLLNKSLKPNLSLDQEITEYIEKNREKTFNALNFRIEVKEIIDSARHLKANKAAGVDGIVNEILKASMSSLINPMKKIFNVILTNGHYPLNWRENTLSPLFKKGDELDPKNYRGIAVAVSMSKLFLTILQLRLKRFSDDYNIVPDCQIAYTEKKALQTISLQ